MQYQTPQHARYHNISPFKFYQCPQLIKAFLEVKRVCAYANYCAGYLNKPQYQAINNAINQLKKDPFSEKFVVDLLEGGGGIALHMNISEAILQETQKFNIKDLSLNDINLHQSTADTLRTSLDICLHKQGQALKQSLIKVMNALEKKTIEFKDIKITAQTCLRDACETTLGHRFYGILMSYQDILASLERALEPLTHLSLGGTVIGTSYGASPDYLKQLPAASRKFLGPLFILDKDRLKAAQNIDDYLALSACIQQLGLTLIKIGQQWRLMGSGPQYGYKLITIPPLVKGSSFFNNKINPTLWESIMQAGFQVQGLTQAVHLSASFADWDLQIFQPFAGINLLCALDILHRTHESLAQYGILDIDLLRSEKNETTSSS